MQISMISQKEYGNHSKQTYFLNPYQSIDTYIYFDEKLFKNSHTHWFTKKFSKFIHYKIQSLQKDNRDNLQRMYVDTSIY